MKSPSFPLRILDAEMAVSRLPADAPLPPESAPFFSATRTADELSIIGPADQAPKGARSKAGWRAIVVDEFLDFSLVGVLHSLITPLSEAGISVVAISTHDTDYVLVQQSDLSRSVERLTEAGHRFVTSP